MAFLIDGEPTAYANITMRNKEFVSAQALTQEQYNTAVDKETVEIFRELGGKEETAPFGHKSTSPDGVTVAYIGLIDKMPKFVRKHIEED